MNNDGVYTIIWIHEEEKWYYFKGDFDENQFLDGYVDYYVTVKDDMVTEDTLNSEHEGMKFSEAYKGCEWEEAEIL